MAIETTRFDVLDHLKTPEDRFAYLDAVFEAGDPSLVAHALGDVARSIVSATSIPRLSSVDGGGAVRCFRTSALRALA